MANQHEFPEEGVTVSVPDQKDHGPVNVRKEPPGSKSDMPDQADFTVIRLLINILLTKATAIDPPAVLRVRITPQDVSAAGGKRIKLGYWDQSQRKWVVLTDNFTLHPDPLPASGGYAEVNFSKRGDPPTGLGH